MEVPGWRHRGIEVLLDLGQAQHRIEQEARRIAVVVEVEELYIAAGEVRRIVVEVGVRQTAAEVGLHRTAAEEEGHHIDCSQVEALRSHIESDRVGIDLDLDPIDPVVEVEHHKVLGEVVGHKAAVQGVRRSSVEVEVHPSYLVEVVHCIHLVVVDSCCCSTTCLNEWSGEGRGLCAGLSD